MSNYNVSFTVGQAGPFEADVENVELAWIPRTTTKENKAVVDEEGNAVLGEDGLPKTEEVEVTLSPAHFEDESVAVLAALREAVDLESFEKNELTEAQVTIEYSIRGSVTHYFSDYDLTDISNEDELVDAIESGQFEDELKETIVENIDSYDIEVTDISIDSVS